MLIVFLYFNVLIIEAFKVFDFSGLKGVDPALLNPSVPNAAGVCRASDITLNLGVTGAVLSHKKEVLTLGKLFNLVKAEIVKFFALIVVFVRLILTVPKGVFSAAWERPTREIDLNILPTESSAHSLKVSERAVNDFSKTGIGAAEDDGAVAGDMDLS